MFQDGTARLLHQHLALAVLLLLVLIRTTKQPLAEAYRFLRTLISLDSAVDKDVCGMGERCCKCNVLLKLCAWRVRIVLSVCSTFVKLFALP